MHDWRPTGDIRPHAGDDFVVYVRCAHCKLIGFRKPPAVSVYTWQQGENDGTLCGGREVSQQRVRDLRP